METTILYRVACVDGNRFWILPMSAVSRSRRTSISVHKAELLFIIEVQEGAESQTACS